MKIPSDIQYTGTKAKIVESESDPEDWLMMNKDNEWFEDDRNYTKFVKNVERIVRTSPHYSAFVRYIKEIVGINFCQVSSKIYDTDATIEMHHGPIFTLYDICSIILNDFMNHHAKINTMRVAKRVLKEHFDLHVQVVMLTVTNHEAAHNRDLFLNVNQGIIRLDEFINIYQDALEDVHKYKLWNYINICKDNPSFDNGYLDIDHVEKLIKL